MPENPTVRLSEGDLARFRRLNTPTVYNGWEQVTSRDIAAECFNIDEAHDFMPYMGTMVGYAVTCVIEPSNPARRTEAPDAWSQYLSYVANVPGPKIVVVQDLDKPAVIGSFWGEVNSTTHRSLGCVGTITDGAIRDLDEMQSVGFKALANRLCVGHAHVYAFKWNCEVEVFGCKVQPGQLIHADQHGFLAIPPGEEKAVLEAARFMDENECDTVIAAARAAEGKSPQEALALLNAGIDSFRANLAKALFRKPRS